MTVPTELIVGTTRGYYPSRGGWATLDLYLTDGTTRSFVFTAKGDEVRKCTVDVFRSAVRRSRRELAEEIAIYCPNCGAQTKIRKGTTKQCEYCGGYFAAPKG